VRNALDLAGIRCLVTGATGTLGAEVARILHARGADLVLTGRSTEKLSRLADTLGQRGTRAVQTVALDLSAAGAIPRLVESLKGRLDILVNNAAVQGPIGPLAATDWDQWETTLRFDLLVPIELTRAVLGFLADGRTPGSRRGKVIILSGGGATGPRPNFSAYAVAKTGLVRFAECLAIEVRDSFIDVNAIAPGALPGTMARSILAAGPEYAIGDERATAEKAMGPAGLNTLSRAAELVAYLAGPASDGITGRLISAVWDPWPRLAEYREALAASDVYTLRRIVPLDRGLDWD